MSPDGRPAHRVVCTGIGVCTVAGQTPDAVWETLLAAPGTLVSPLKDLGTPQWDTPHWDEIPLPVDFAAAMPDFTPDELPGLLARRIDRSTQIGLTAAQRAFRDARGEELDPDTGGISVGSGVGGLGSLLAGVELARSAPRQVRAYGLPMSLPGATAAETALLVGWRGPSLAHATACAAGAHAVGEGFRLVRDGYARAVLCGGAEAAVEPSALFGFGRLRALATDVDDPARSSRPFDRERCGFVMGEGAAYLLLERADSAAARGVHCHGEILGYAATNDAHHVVAPDPDGTAARRCVQAALADAGVEPDQVMQVNAHGTATTLNDAVEALILRQVFGRAVPTTAVKGVTGHLFGASGALEAVVALRQAVTGTVPPTANYRATDIDGADGLACAEVRHTPPGPVVSNAFAFGGHNAVLVVGPADPAATGGGTGGTNGKGTT